MKEIGNGDFGIIYKGLKGAQALSFLLKEKKGEVIGALHHKDVGEIDIFWGNNDVGLKKILLKHPEVINEMQAILDNSSVIQKSSNRIKLESLNYRSVIRLDWNGKQKTWLLTMYEKTTK